VDPASTVATWLASFQDWLTNAESRGPVPPELSAGLIGGDGFGETACLVFGPGANSEVLTFETTHLLRLWVRDESPVEIEYDRLLFSGYEIVALGRHLDTLLRGIINLQGGPIAALPMLSPDEESRLLHEWNQTEVAFRESACLHELFEEQVARTPDSVAVVCRDQQWTYKSLKSMVDALATRLRGNGIGKGKLAAIAVERSPELLCAMLAVAKSGGAYIPLDPSYPLERLELILAEARPAAIIVSERTRAQFRPAHSTVLTSESSEQGVQYDCETAYSSQSPAYVIFTSGSTGKPKGVVITHRNVSNFLTGMDNIVGTEVGTWLAVTSASFDISVLELLWTVTRGFRVVIHEEIDLVSPNAAIHTLPEQMKQHGVTHFQCTPSLASLLIRDRESTSALKPLRKLIVGGEALGADLAGKLARTVSGEVWNLYGPTETTVWSTAQRIHADSNKVLIGRPIANTRVFVLDRLGRPVPVGCAGELYIGGAGVAAGYLNQPELTAERFAQDPFSAALDGRLYRTGDFVRYLPDGTLEFLGRADQQLKIRGLRIELSEIEASMRAHHSVSDAAVVARQTGTHDKRLLGYVILRPAATLNETEFRQWLGERLPEAMIPARVIFLGSFPRTPNGKLDKNALPDPGIASSSGHDHPMSDVEREIAAIWADVLQVNCVGLTDRFFDLGGHSLLVAELLDRIQDGWGSEITLVDLFRYPTVQSLAEFLERRTVSDAAAGGSARGILRQRARRKRAAAPGSLPR
jgi:amino acid adenylation domain-containing protein